MLVWAIFPIGHYYSLIIIFRLNDLFGHFLFGFILIFYLLKNLVWYFIFIFFSLIFYLSKKFNWLFILFLFFEFDYSVYLRFHIVNHLKIIFFGLVFSHFPILFLTKKSYEMINNANLKLIERMIKLNKQTKR